jgi:O-antigen ligase
VPGRREISIDLFRSQTELLKLCGLAALTLIGVAIGQDDDRAHVTWNTIGVLGAAYVAWVLFLHFQPVMEGRPPQKLVATLGGTNVAATFLSILTVISWTAVLRAGVSLTHQSFSGDRLTSAAIGAAPWGVLLLLSLGALSLTGSRGGAGACFVGLLASTFTMIWGEHRNRRALILIGAATALAVFCFGLLVISSGATAARLSQVDGALANRREIVDIYLAKMVDMPWTGFGLGTFRRFNALLIGSDHNQVLWDLGALHNVALQWVLEAGYIGAAAMFATIAQLLITLLGGLRRRRFGRTWIAGATAITAVLLTHGMIDFGLQVPAIAGVWALALGVGVGVSRPSRGRSNSSSSPSMSSQ